MRPPENVDILETPSSISWLDEEGFICSISRKLSLQSFEESKKSMEAFIKKYGNKKYCYLIDVTNAAPTNKEGRDYADKALPEVARAIAIIINSVFGKMPGILFLGLTVPPYPAGIFDNEKEARNWLRHYL